MFWHGRVLDEPPPQGAPRSAGHRPGDGARRVTLIHSSWTFAWLELLHGVTYLVDSLEILADTTELDIVPR